MKLNGIVYQYRTDKRIGVITSRDEAGAITKYFFHLDKVVVCKPETVEVGCPVRFEFNPAFKPEHLPYAFDIEIDVSPAQKIAAGQKALAQTIAKDGL